MNTDPKGKDLFIVDNSVSGWTGLRYLEEWTQIAKSFDIATGYFEIGSLLALDGKWQQLEKIRILMGAETTHRTRKALYDSIKLKVTEQLDKSIENDKETNPFLHGVPAILDALKLGKIECRVYDKEKFHAKGYITHAKLEVIGAQALVGSSNFTRPGLTKNIELNVQVQSAREVAQLQEWFEKHWSEANEIKDAVIEIIARHVHLYTPFDIYAKALQEYFRGHELTASEWDETRSRMFPKLDRYQKEAYWALMKIARQHQGAFLCDGVGLGKTFVGLMLIERLILHEGKRVVLFAPKGAKESVWEPHLRDYLSHIGGIGGNADFSNLAVFSHTDLGRKGEYPDRFRRMTELADVVIIDEAHHFRNPGRKGDVEKDIEPSRYFRLYDILDNSQRPKTLFLLTATPINNELHDFRHMAELFTRRDETYFARTLGVNNLRAHFNKMERSVRNMIGSDTAGLSDHLAEAQQILAMDEIFRQLVVQRSRAYARESQFREFGIKTTVFPERNPPKVAEYSIRKTYGHLLEMFEKAFQKSKPLFTLAMYYPLAWYIGKDKSIDPMEEGRQKQVVGLIRILFLKRFESSVCAFESSCFQLMKKLLAFLEVHSQTESEHKRLNRWKEQNSGILEYICKKQQQFNEEEEQDFDQDIFSQELLQIVERLDSNEYNISEMIQETFLDLEQIVHFIEETKKFESRHDDKLKKLIRLLTSKEVTGNKMLIFTEFADTARYLYRELKEADIEGVDQVDSMSTDNRAEVIKRFSPYYNGLSSPELVEKGWKEIRVLISTDVLSEGLNLQDASHMINYDIHWNPVRIMQRIGRVDRRLNPEIEDKLINDHPEIKSIRGKISFWNFLPPDELNEILSLYKTVTRKTLLISKTLGIEGKKLLRPEDDYDALREFNQAYEGSKTVVENMHLEYQSLLQIHPGLEEKLKQLPEAIFSGKEKVAKGSLGVFFCYALPALDKENNEFTEEAGMVRWYLYDIDRNAILEEPNEIVESIRSKPETPRKCILDEKLLIDLKVKVEKHIKNTYLKRIDAPIGIKPKLKCWMELN